MSLWMVVYHDRPLDLHLNIQVHASVLVTDHVSAAGNTTSRAENEFSLSANLGGLCKCVGRGIPINANCGFLRERGLTMDVDKKTLAHDPNDRVAK